MNTEAVIFDKDGTLMDFDSFWVPVSERAIESALLRFGGDVSLVPEIMEALGVRDGVTDTDGVLCKGTYEQIGDIVYNTLQKSGVEASREAVLPAVVTAYNESVGAGEAKPTCDNLKEVLLELRGMGARLAVVTTDNAQITHSCLEALGIAELFDEIYTDDGVRPTKPDPFCALDFCRKYNIKKECAVMVGDTLTDALFAKNAGISMIGIAKSERNGALLGGVADAVVSDPSRLIEILK